MCLSTDERYLLDISGKQIHMWDLDAKKKLRLEKGHTGCICDAKVTTDGQMLITAGTDTTVRVFDL